MDETNVSLSALSARTHVFALDRAMVEAGQRADDTTLRRFAFACCRRVWDLLADSRSRSAIETMERVIETTIWQQSTEAWQAVIAATQAATAAAIARAATNLGDAQRYAADAVVQAISHNDWAGDHIPEYDAAFKQARNVSAKYRNKKHGPGTYDRCVWDVECQVQLALIREFLQSHTSP